MYINTLHVHVHPVYTPWVGKCNEQLPLTAHPGTVEGVGDKEEGHHNDHHTGYLILDGVAAVSLLLLCLGVKDVQVSHEDGEDV